MAQLKPCMKGPNEIVPFNHPHIHYPQLASQKFDGHRMLNLCGERLVSPALKDIPNKNLHSHLDLLFQYCQDQRIVTDGELWSPDIPFEEIQSVIRSYSKPIPPSLKYYIFDMMTEHEWDNGTELPYIQRYLNVQQTLTGFDNIVQVPHIHIVDAMEAEALFAHHISVGNEGVILRALDAKYKHGRTTVNQDGMWKFKEFQTCDAVVIGVEEQLKLREGVERKLTELGNLAREFSKELYEPAGMVGAFIVRDATGLTFKVKPGKGRDNDWKKITWQQFQTQPHAFVGKHVEYKHMPHGAKDKPRIGSFIRFRQDLD